MTLAASISSPSRRMRSLGYRYRLISRTVCATYAPLPNNRFSGALIPCTTCASSPTPSICTNSRVSPGRVATPGPQHTGAAERQRRGHRLRSERQPQLVRQHVGSAQRDHAQPGACRPPCRSRPPQSYRHHPPPRSTWRRCAPRRAPTPSRARRAASPPVSSRIPFADSTSSTRHNACARRRPAVGLKMTIKICARGVDSAA